MGLFSALTRFINRNQAAFETRASKHRKGRQQGRTRARLASGASSTARPIKHIVGPIRRWSSK